MEYSTHIFTKEEAWDFILKSYFYYHNKLKSFGYGYEQFIPDFQPVRDMFENETHFDKMKKGEFFTTDVKNIKENFYNFYNFESFQNATQHFRDKVEPEIDAILPKLQELRDNWGMYIPDKLEIGFAYGNGGSYDADKKKPGIILRTGDHPLDKMAFVSIHELVHICIEEDIVKKYNLPQDVKEQIVDIICVDYLGVSSEKQRFNNTAVSKFLTVDNVVENLPAVAKNIKDTLSAHKHKKPIRSQMP